MELPLLVLGATSLLVVEKFPTAPSLGCRGTAFYFIGVFLAHTSLPHDSLNVNIRGYTGLVLSDKKMFG